jgi:hypothetical protein
MITFMRRKTRCQIHGEVEGNRCRLCDMIRTVRIRKELEKLGVAKPQPDLKEGSGRLPQDPNPLQILHRCRKERENREEVRDELYDSGSKRWWKTKSRSTKQYPDELFNGH